MFLHLFKLLFLTGLSFGERYECKSNAECVENSGNLTKCCYGENVKERKTVCVADCDSCMKSTFNFPVDTPVCMGDSYNCLTNEDCTSSMKALDSTGQPAKFMACCQIIFINGGKAGICTSNCDWCSAREVRVRGARLAQCMNAEGGYGNGSYPGCIPRSRSGEGSSGPGGDWNPDRRRGPRRNAADRGTPRHFLATASSIGSFLWVRFRTNVVG